MEGGSGRIQLKTDVRQCDKEFLRDCHLADSLDEGEYVFCEVSDSGVGMTQETLEKIFDPFYTTKFKGRGLGLAAVLGIVRSHKGMIRVVSQPGVGTDFSVYFPATSNEAPTLHPTKASDSKWAGEGTVLLADDEAAVRNIGKRILERTGFEVILAEDGIQCLDCFLDHRKDIRVVVLDLTMPRMSGEDVFQKLIELDPKVRVILSSGFSESEITSRSIGEGLAGFLQKPYSPIRLIEKIREVIENSRE